MVEENSPTVVSYPEPHVKLEAVESPIAVRRGHVPKDVEVCLHLYYSIHGIERYLSSVNSKYGSSLQLHLKI